MNKIIELIKKEYQNCHICPKNCGVNRLKDERGFCGVGRDSKVFNTTVLVKECEEFAPTYAIYFAGCNLHCKFCSVAEENRLICTEKERVQIITGLTQDKEIKMVTDFIDIDGKFIEKLKKDIAKIKPKTISFIGGEPSVHLLTIFELIEKLNPRLPLVFYTNLYFNQRVGRIIGDFFEFVVADMHFGNDICARMNTEKKNTQISTNYWETVKNNAMLLKEKLILRHLLLPGHVGCCFKKIVDWTSKEMQNKSLWLLTSYFPYLNARICTDGNSIHGLARRISTDEIKGALDYARKTGIIVKMLALLKSGEAMEDCLSDNQEIVIDEEGTVVFKYMDGMAVEIGRDFWGLPR